MKIFLDTNVFLELILKRKNSNEALRILNSVQNGIFEGMILDITLLNIDYIAKKQVRGIREFLQAINDVFLVVGATNKMVEKALRIQNNDFEDNLQFISAKENLCDTIISNDKTFYTEDIPILTCKGFCKKYL